MRLCKMGFKAAMNPTKVVLLELFKALTTWDENTLVVNFSMHGGDVT